MKGSTLLLATSIGLSRLAFAQNNTVNYRGSFGGGPVTGGRDYDLFVSANRNAEVTRSAPINGSEGLIWRVNVSTVSVPDARSPTSDSYEDPQVVQTVYDLQYPGGGTLDDYINRTSEGVPRRVCAVIFSPPSRHNNFPPNVTDRYNEGDNGNCDNVLGADCVAAYLRSGRALPNGCYSFDWNVPECVNTLRAGPEQYSLGMSLGNGTAPNGTSPSGLPYNSTEMGIGFYHVQSAAFNGSNTTEVDLAENRLQVMALTNLVPGQRQLLCQRVSFSSGGRIEVNWLIGIFAAGLAVMATLL